MEIIFVFHTSKPSVGNNIKILHEITYLRDLIEDKELLLKSSSSNPSKLSLSNTLPQFLKPFPERFNVYRKNILFTILIYIKCIHRIDLKYIFCTLRFSKAQFPRKSRSMSLVKRPLCLSCASASSLLSITLLSNTCRA